MVVTRVVRLSVLGVIAELRQRERKLSRIFEFKMVRYWLLSIVVYVGLVGASVKKLKLIICCILLEMIGFTTEFVYFNVLHGSNIKSE